MDDKGHREPDDPKRWRTWYGAVLGTLLVLIALLAALSARYQ